MILIQVAVKFIGARLGLQGELAAAAGACVRLIAAYGGVKLFNRIDWRVANNGKSGSDSVAGIASAARPPVAKSFTSRPSTVTLFWSTRAPVTEPVSVTPGCMREECDRVHSLLHGKAVELIHVEGIADRGIRGIDGDFRG